jgi:ankyrin repeat protein
MPFASFGHCSVRMAAGRNCRGGNLTLAEAGNVPPTDPGWRKGLRYLLSTRNPDGSWRVSTRMVTPVQVSPPYFETGFPFGHDQFISSAGTSYAVMALLLALPKVEKAAPAPRLAELEPKGVQPWMRTALFGTPKEFQSLLDGGLDPASHTGGGTTLLMMAAPDAVKMKMLLDRGVDVNAKAKSGFTALMVASLYRGSFDAVQLLLARGAKAAPGTGVMFNASPLLLAVFAGEPATLQLLHSKGADANRRMLLLGAFPASPLAQAVAMGEPEVIRTLVAAGADIREHDPDGTSLLQMAAMTNHVEAAEALIAAGAPLNDADKHGYTPLLYASTVDFGDDRMVNLLLKAGADPKLRTKAGETPLSQAKRYHYAHIEAALEKAGARE